MQVSTVFYELFDNWDLSNIHVSAFIIDIIEISILKFFRRKIKSAIDMGVLHK